VSGAESIIPGERTLSGDEMRLIQDMHQAGRTPEDIAARIGGVEPVRIAALVAPKRPTPKKVWRRR
jgi:hypothetical protein